MKTASLLLVSAALLCGRPVFAQPASVAKEKPEPVFPTPAAVAVSTDDAETGDPDLQLAEQLKQAEALYDEGLRHFKAGEAEEGRAALKKAFDIVLDNLDEDALPASMHGDFLAMLDKIRNWEEPEEGAEDSASVDAAVAAMSSATASSKMRGIKVDADNPITQRFIEVYTKQRPRQTEEALAASGRYKDMMEKALKDKGLPAELFHLVMAESEYKLDAYSRAGAAGLWQFMPQTARKYGLEVSYWVDERYMPEKATQAAIAYLRDLYAWFGDWHLALAAYNRGEGGLGRDMQYSRSLDFDSLSGRHALPLQTNHYVPKFMACVLIGEHPEKYGFHPGYAAPEPYDVVALPRDLELGIAARCAGTTEADIHRLNPQLRAWCTPKDRPGFELRVPKGSKDAFLANLAKVEDWNPGPTLVRYKVRPGDSLGKIAKLHHTSVRAIMEINKIRNAKLLKPGMTVLVRPDHGRSGGGRRRHRSG